MKNYLFVRSVLVILVFSLVSSVAVFAQMAIDKPVATFTLTKTEVVSQVTFKKAVDTVEKQQRRVLTQTERRDLLTAEINAGLFLQYCDREGITVTDTDVNAVLNQTKQQLGPNATDDQFNAALLQQNGISLADYKKAVKRQLLFQKYIQKTHPDVLKQNFAPSADEVLKTYDLTKTGFVRPETMRVSLIFVDIRNLKDSEKQAALDQLRSMSKAIKADATKFDEYALKVNDSPKNLYKVQQNLAVPKTPQAQQAFGAKFVDAVFAMKAGDISAVLETESGYQIVRVAEYMPQKQLVLSDPIGLPNNPQATVQDVIKYQLTQKRQQEALAAVQDDMIKEVNKGATIKIIDENLNF